MTAAPTAPDRDQFWSDAVADYAKSGLSVRAYCLSRGLHEKAFYTHRRRLGLSPVARPALPPAGPAAPKVAAFVPIRVVPDSVAELILPGGLSLRVPLSADPAAVAALARALAKSC